MTDYSVYRLSREERVRFYLCACPLLALLGLLFYRSAVISLACAAAARAGERFYADYLAGKRRSRLQEGFRDALYSISASVAAGRSMPAALGDAAAQSETAYGPDADITRELRSIVDVYHTVHGDAAALLTDLGRRSHISEIAQFASSYSICRLCGGDLEDVCMKSAGILLDKMAFRSEAESLMAQKKLDILFLVSLPVLMLAFLNVAAFDYISALYRTLSGRAVMTACFAAIGGALFWSIKIVDIEL